MREIYNVEQGSQKWLDLRKKYLTASEAPAMMGVSKYKTRDQLLKEKATGEREVVSSDKQALFDRGHEAEAPGRKIAEEILGEDLFPVVGVDDTETYLASFDGLTMLGDTGFEHKLFNQELAALVEAQSTELNGYEWQLEHQLLVSGAGSILFMVSDGTKEKMVFMRYEPVDGRREQLIKSWEQFKHDLENFEHKEVAPAPVGREITELPALTVEMSGQITSTNLPEFKRQADQFLSSLKTELKTDQDFADAEVQVKVCKKTEKMLAQVLKDVMEQNASIAEFTQTVERYIDKIRKVRLDSDRKVKSEKATRRKEIIDAAKQELKTFLASFESRIVAFLPPVSPDFENAIKGKKLLSSMVSAVNDAVAQEKIRLRTQLDLISQNLDIIDRHKEHHHLFADKSSLVLNDTDSVGAVVAMRINAYKKQEAERLERAKKEEAERIEREQKAKQEAERIERERINREEVDAKNTKCKQEQKTHQEKLGWPEYVALAEQALMRAGLDERSASIAMDAIITRAVPGVTFTPQQTAAA